MTGNRMYLFPLSLLYGCVVRFRNFLFDVGIMKSRTYADVMVVGVGNLSTGGTGKSPFVEYIVERYGNDFSIAILSRGYGRKTKGFRICTINDTYLDIGDEPHQFVAKYDNVVVAVDKNRRRGIEKIKSAYPKVNMILLDDSYQHRWIKPTLNILLTSYYNLYTSNCLLPAGNLREHAVNAKRADVIIVTKCDNVLSPIVARQLHDTLNVHNKKLLFTTITYEDIRPMKGSYAEEHPLDLHDHKYSTAICFSGIENNYLFTYQAKQLFNDIDVVEFGDHYHYTLDDLKKINKLFIDNYGNKKFILTTEKDIQRLQLPEFEELIKTMPIYYLPMKVAFCNNGASEFDEMIRSGGEGRR